MLRWVLVASLVAVAINGHSYYLNDNVNKVCRNLKYEVLVLEGGGLKGLSYVGAMKALAKHGYYTNNVWQFKNISGTSIGCLFGYFVALDISPDNLYTIAMSTNFTELFHKNVKSVLNVPKKTVNTVFGKIDYFWRLLDYVRQVFNIWYNNDAPGVSTGSEIISWIMMSVLKYSPYKHIINVNTTFAEFEDITQHALTCYVTKIGKDASLMELNARNAPQQKIINVLYSSMTLPILFKPLTDKLGDTLVDGGLILNFPIYQQDWNDRKNTKVLGLSLHEQPNNDRRTVDAFKSFNFLSTVNRYSTINTFSYLTKLIDVVTSMKSYILYSNDPRNCDRVIYLNSNEISMIDLNLTADKISKSINTAYEQTAKFMKSSNTAECSKRRSRENVLRHP